MQIQSSSFPLRLLGVASLAVFSLLSAPNLFAASTGEPGSDSTGPNPLRNVYFGEQHLHTAASPDSFSVGNRFDIKYLGEADSDSTRAVKKLDGLLDWAIEKG